MSQRSRALIAAAGLAAAALLTLSACSSSSAGHPAPDSGAPSAAPSTPEVSTTPAAPILAVPMAEPTLEALVPNAQKVGTKLVVAVDTSDPPYEYIDSGGDLAGLNIDLFNAIASKLGLTADFVTVSGPTQILAGVRSAKYAAGLGSFADTKALEKQVTVVDVYAVGTQWAARKGDPLTPSTACGRKVGVFAATAVAKIELPALTAGCKKIGEAAVTVVPVTSYAEAASAIANNTLDAIAGDSTSVGYYVQQSAGVLQLASPLSGAVPYGVVVSLKSTTFDVGIEQATQSLIADGNYADILAKWGVTPGSLKKATINAAKN